MLHPDLLPFTQCTTCNLPNAAYPHCHRTATLRPLRSGHSTESSSHFQPPHAVLSQYFSTQRSVRVPFTRMLEVPKSSYPPPGKVNKMRCHEPQSCCDPCHNRCSRASQKPVSSLSPVCCVSLRKVATLPRTMFIKVFAACHKAERSSASQR